MDLLHRFVSAVLALAVIHPSFAITRNPMTLFPATTNQLIPQTSWLDNKKPYPTNAWFINFVLKGTNPNSDPVNAFPYLLQTQPNGVGLSYSGPIFYSAPSYPTIISAFYYQFENQLRFGTVEPMSESGVASYHGLVVNLEWNNKSLQKMIIPLMQGSPYLTEMFTNATPQLASRFKWLSINNQKDSGSLPLANRFELVLALDEKNTQTWIVYSEKPIEFIWERSPDGQKLTAMQPYSGWMRIVLQKDTAQAVDNDVSILDEYSQTIPIDYKQNYFSTDNALIYSFSWQTQNNKPPLMLSLPHQRKTTVARAKVSYPGIKGLMIGETKANWSIPLPKIPVVFLEPKSLSNENVKAIRDALRVDAQLLIQHPFPDEGPYLVGKGYARIARLILIAHQLQEYALQKQMLEYIKTHLSQKMVEKKAWHFEYDTTWGGIIPSIDDYGARHYTDHHFHYGYWVYTFAVIAKLDKDWMTSRLASQSFTPKEWIEGLIQDYANNDQQNPYFPMQRHQDDYAGHSWASGLVSFKDGQNQQSSSEAVNAYYALALYATAMNEANLLSWAQFLMTRELVSAQWYWQIAKDSIYNSQFIEHNQVVGNLWGSKIDSDAFFTSCKKEYRCGLHYSFGIQMLPFTAISFYLFDKNWLRNAYPTIKKLIAGEYGAITPAWQWILIKGIIPIMDINEKQYFFKRAIHSNPQDYDNGDSKTNTLYFLS